MFKPFHAFTRWIAYRNNNYGLPLVSLAEFGVVVGLVGVRVLVDAVVGQVHEPIRQRLTHVRVLDCERIGKWSTAIGGG